MPDWQVREVTMYYTVDLIYAFIAGLLLGAGVVYWFATRLFHEVRKETRQWRKDAIAAKQDATFWQNAYSKEMTK